MNTSSRLGPYVLTLITRAFCAFAYAMTPSITVGGSSVMSRNLSPSFPHFADGRDPTEVVFRVRRDRVERDLDRLDALDGAFQFLGRVDGSDSSPG